MMVSRISYIWMRVVSFVWGFAEASFFFFVPDIWLSYLVLRNSREGYLNIVLATAGAIIGGLGMYYWGFQEFGSARFFLDMIPAINSQMIEGVGVEMRAGSVLTAMQLGSITGIPYKIYAVWAGHLAEPLGVFAFYTAIVRGLRFFAVVAFADILSRILKPRIGKRAVLQVYVVSWMVFYCFYFYAVGLNL